MEICQKTELVVGDSQTKKIDLNTYMFQEEKM